MTGSVGEVRETLAEAYRSLGVITQQCQALSVELACLQELVMSVGTSQLSEVESMIAESCQKQAACAQLSSSARNAIMEYAGFL